MRTWLKFGIVALSAAFAGVGMIAAGSLSAFAAKDVGPASTDCDSHAKRSAAWQACVHSAHNDTELFYAGYWLARAGRYEDALEYLKRAQVKDERVLTYIGFATRKLGGIDKAIRFYDRALALNPDYAVARAYLGEAYLTLDRPDRAETELDEIAKRCGTTCPPYADLEQHIATYKTAKANSRG